MAVLGSVRPVMSRAFLCLASGDLTKYMGQQAQMVG
jgi:hypothetical protein